VDIGRRKAATPPWPELVPVRTGLVPVRSGLVPVLTLLQWNVNELQKLQKHIKH